MEGTALSVAPFQGLDCFPTTYREFRFAPLPALIPARLSALKRGCVRRPPDRAIGKVRRPQPQRGDGSKPGVKRQKFGNA